MSSREELIRVVRRTQTFISILLFFIVFFICWKFTKFDITQVQISIWGRSGFLGRVWNTAVCTFIHNYSAGLYFFFYPLTIFSFSHLNRKYLSYKDWLHYVILSVGMAIIPMILISMFKGMAIAEIAHTFLVILYNIKLSMSD